jgi:ariadne-1
MTCKMCTFEFCWLCLGNWKEHGQSTGGYYNCNKYEELKKTGNLSDLEKKRESAKNELARYMFYFERFVNHDKA